MATQQGPLNELLPEIFPVIVAHLPLHATPSTLLALALTNHHISEIALPLVYSRLVLKNESDAIVVLQKLVDNPPFGRIVRELHIMSDLSVDTRKQDPPSDVIRRVEDVISKGCLPFIHTLGLQLMNRWYYDFDEFEAVKGFGQLRKEFWVQLKVKCPRLRGLVLKGFQDDPDAPWLEESGFLQVPDITSLTIRFKRFTLWQSGSDKFLGHISSLAPLLHTLDLRAASWDRTSFTSSIFKLDLPVLRSLSLSLFTDLDTTQAMAFFERHPSIEYLNVASNLIHAHTRWFTSELPQKFLPNLRHLSALWKDVRLLAHMLDQLLSLSIHQSINAQIPYLLRFILPNGLPNLKSLDIGQSASSREEDKSKEGSLWYESEDGTFQQAKEESRTVFDGYMHSIVRAAPNLEELGFHGSLFQLSEFVSIADDLKVFPHLKHLYYEDYYANLRDFTEEDRNNFASHARALAEAIPGLASITNADTPHLPYLSIKISRRESGEVAGVEVGKGYGMKIGYEDEAFPWAPYESC